MGRSTEKVRCSPQVILGSPLYSWVRVFSGESSPLGVKDGKLRANIGRLADGRKEEKEVGGKEYVKKRSRNKECM